MSRHRRIPVCHSLLASASLYVLLLRLDQDLAEEARRRGCPLDGGALHRADFERRPRGGPAALGRQDRLRTSFCCANHECRKRVTPPSMRFLGRRVYLGAFVVLVGAMRHGLSERRVAKLRERFGVARSTLVRWRRWWRETFADSPCFAAVRGHLAAPVNPAGLPASLLERFAGDERQRLLAMLRVLLPLTTTSAETARLSMGM